MSLTSITLVFENCESVSIPSNSIDSLYIGRVSQHRTYNKRTNKFVDGHHLEDMYLSLSSFCGITTTCNEPLYKRLQVATDITHLILVDDKLQEDSYSVRWVGDSQYNNYSQRKGLIENECLFIRIGE